MHPSARTEHQRPSSSQYYYLASARIRSAGVVRSSGEGKMRSGGCAVQQALAADAAAVMRQAVSVARRRGHAQVTPLHVASAMLADAAGGGLLRAACLRSRATSHPLQCKALELCFNVALNRLATAGGAPPAAAMLAFQHAGHRAPALSNALAAAFKRAQASQRRGGGSASGEGQQAGKVELEQLVISILDDPSVSRVMREAGFSSAEVKANVEKAVVSSTELSSNTVSSSSASPNPCPKASKPKIDVGGDAERVLDCMASGRKRCVAVVGESAAAAEGVVKAVMDKVSKGELQLQCLKNLQFVPFSAASFQRLPREQVDARAGDLRALVREGCAAGKAVVLVLEDLGYAAEAWAAAYQRRSGHGHYCYCPVEHAVMELSGLVRGGRGHDRDRFWLLAFAARQSYTTCRAGQPSLEAALDLHPVVVPDGGGLAFSLDNDSELTYCGTEMVMATAASVPSWFRRCQGPVLTGSELTLSFSSPAASSDCGFTHCDANLSSNPWHDLSDRRQLWLSHRHDGPTAESHNQQWLASPNPVSSNSASKSISSDGATQPADRRQQKLTELTAENLKILCSALETRVPRHRDVVPGIASAVLQRRSGVTRTARPSSATWLLFQGGDSDGKKAMARELARIVFGSYTDFTTITKTVFTTPGHSGSSSGGELSLKRPRSLEKVHNYLQCFYEVIRENPHRVVLLNALEQSENDSEGEAGIMNAITTGTVRGCNGDVVSLEDAIVVLSCEVFESWSRAPTPRRLKQRVMGNVDGKEEKGVMQPRFCLDLNACAIDGERGEGTSLDGVEILNAVDGVFSFQC